MTLFSLQELKAIVPLVNNFVPPTPTYPWPLLEKRLGCSVWVKHENHTPTGAFKMRGGIVYMDNIEENAGACMGVVSATRGNHGQSIALAASQKKIPSVIVTPENNSLEKNAAMRALGAELIIEGADFDESRQVAKDIEKSRSLHMIPSFHTDLVKGVATYALEMFRDSPPLHAVYVPVGMGSGICAVITVRDLLGLETEIIGVVSTEAAAIALSFESDKIIGTKTAATYADGMACRDPNPEAMDIIRQGASRIVQVSDDEIAAATRIYFSDTHNVAEGAGAAPLAALIQERRLQQDKSIGVVLTGGNIDTNWFAEILSGITPEL